MKILSPAGDFQSLKSAVFAGADEVYMGINKFNARNNVESFTMDDIKNAVDFAHLYGVKVALAVNILFNDTELSQAVELCVNCHNLGVDSFIICDLGLAKILSTDYPEITLHASTQLGVHNLEGVRALAQFNFKRVVLSRETALCEIERIKENTDIEIEYFAHGALCVCFSGNCYMSAKMLNASGNRGKCKQLCRLPYTLLLKDKTIKTGFLLSAKDFNMLKRLKDLKKAGVDVLKIEGRARRPFYVYYATKAYRQALDGKPFNSQSVDLAFNRGFCEGYFNGNGNMISEHNSHIGIHIGEVTKVISGKRFNEVFIKTNYELSPKSTLKFFLGKQEVATVSPFDVKNIKDGFSFTTTTNIPQGSQAQLLNDNKLEIQVLEQHQKLECDITVTALKNQPIHATTKRNSVSFSHIGATLQPAKNQPLNIEQVIENFNKSEYFTPNITLDTDGVFIPKQELNEFRREIYCKLYDILTSSNNTKLQFNPITLPSRPNKCVDVKVYYSLNEPITSKLAIFSPELYELNDILQFVKNCNKYSAKAYLNTPNFATYKDIQILKDIIEKTGIGIVANNVYALTLSNDLIVGAGLNVYNSYSYSLFNSPVLTYESDIGEHVDFPVMTLRHCPIKSHLKCNCENCKYQDGFFYQMPSGKKFKLKRTKISDCTFYLTE